MEEEAEKVTVDFQYFIQMAIEKKMAWITLTHLLTDLAATPVKSKQVINLLFQELEKWISKVENTSKNNGGLSENKIMIENQFLKTSLQETETGDDEIEVVKGRFVEEISEN